MRTIYLPNLYVDENGELWEKEELKKYNYEKIHTHKKTRKNEFGERTIRSTIEIRIKSKREYQQRLF